MSALSDIISGAIGNVMAEHPKLFAEQARERAQKVLLREIMKALVREPKAEEDGAPTPEQPTTATPNQIPADDERAIAYRNLREIAGATRPMRVGGDNIYLPAEADTAAVRAFASMPPKGGWQFISARAQLVAWLEFFEAALPNAARRSIMLTRDGVVGAVLPWPWPPSKTGKTYQSEQESAV